MLYQTEHNYDDMSEAIEETKADGFGCGLFLFLCTAVGIAVILGIIELSKRVF